MKLRILLISITILFLGSFANPAFACTCAEATVAQLRGHATAVFLGRVMGKKKSNAVERDGVAATFKVERLWKGSIPEKVIVYTGATEDLYPFLNLCAPPFRVGQRYIVFAYGQNRLATDVCEGTADFPYANKIIGELGRGKRPTRSKP